MRKISLVALACYTCAHLRVYSTRARDHTRTGISYFTLQYYMSGLLTSVGAEGLP